MQSLKIHAMRGARPWTHAIILDGKAIKKAKLQANHSPKGQLTATTAWYAEPQTPCDT